jgi:3-oxoacyl-[acyl-carrier protein] reductase
VSIANRVAVITGGASGIGKASAKVLAGQGAKVCICDRDSEGARAVAESLSRQDQAAYDWTVDVTDSQTVADVFGQIESKVGSIDILITAAGAPGHGMISEITDQAWQQVMDINLNGIMYCMREALKQMLPRKKGTIVNISSVCGLMGCASSPSYSASKAAVIGLSKSCARRHIADGIRVNVLAPGLVDTPFVEPDRKMGKLEAGIRKTPQARMGTAEEIAETIAFLCSDAADYMQGQVISPNGGLYI